ncbi:TonB-dependent receptor domain-containing protein [Caulobacter sp. NIBR2454]|uniref:TonB-dependent receptor domain-containing protein n=1 Tax=Caulobacter sp. NIBR2454 TaxID=3015996 RepID=UPI0022B6244E|nr:TonB-dependent receptor [Caulobacter sp. NIBR2454]
MKKLALSVAGLLATTALVAPHVALAQVDAAAEAQVEAVEVLGRNIPQPMRETAEVSTYISVEDLKRSGDDTAAEALTRVGGLSLVSGKFVYVRGLGERYSSALLNGSPLPSPEPLQRVVPLDLFPSNILGGTVVQKSYSANYSGEFGGGLIDLQTIGVPDEPFFTIGGSFGGNSETSLKRGLTYFGSDTDWLGVDDATRKIPGRLKQAIATGKRIAPGNFTDAELMNIGHSFVNAPLNLLQSTNDIPLNGSIELSGGRSFDAGFATLGVIFSAGYDNGWKTRTGKQQEGLVQNGVLEVRTDYDFSSTQNDVVTNGLLGFGAEWGDNEVRWTNLFIRSTSKEARSRQGRDELAGRDVRDDYTEWFERQLIDTQLAGEHKFDALEIDWRTSYAKSERNAPYEKGIRYRIEDGVTYHSASQEQNYTRFSELNDEVISAGIDFKYAIPLSSTREAVVSAGYAYLDNQRDSWSREFRFTATNGALPLAVQRERVDFLLADYNIGPNGLVLTETTGGDGAAAYEASLKTHGVYAQVDAEIMPLVRLSAGLRYEDAKQDVQVVDLFGGTPANSAPLNNSYVLPAATVTWNFYEDMQLRFGASKTIGRPQFRELAPQQYTDPDSDRLFSGNPYLRDSELLNVEGRYEWYFDRDQYLTVGVFFKDIDKPIESVVSEQGATIVQTYVNAPSATLYGFEIDAKKYFDLPMEGAWFSSKRWLAMANYTYSTSDVKVGDGDVVYPLGAGGAARPASDYVKDGSRLQGQSEHIANVQFGFEDEAARSQATVLLTYVSERISARGRTEQPDLIQDPGVMLDFTYRKTFTHWDQDFTFSFEARNLLDTEYEEYQELGGGRVDNNRYGLGTSVSFGLSAQF